MKLLGRWVIVLLVLAGSLLALFGQNPAPASRQFLVTMGEAWSPPQPAAGPVNAMNCVIVFPDGRLHLELRRQEFFKQKPDLSIFEGSLEVKEGGGAFVGEAGGIVRFSIAAGPTSAGFPVLGALGSGGGFVLKDGSLGASWQSQPSSGIASAGVAAVTVS